jgi:hypothetical protein
MTQFERICRECFWDYTISPEEIQKIISEASYQEKKKLFVKILFNSTDRLADLQLFSENDLQRLLNEPIPAAKSNYMERRIGVLKYLLLHEKNPVKGLEWKKS